MKRIAGVVAACFMLCIAPPLAAAHEYACFAMPETIRVGPEGLRGWIEITSSPGCFPAHSATSTAEWVMPSIPSPAVMPITIAPNLSGLARRAAILFDGVAVATVVQETSACVVSVTPPAVTAAVTADAITFNAVATAPDCYWNVTGFPPPPFSFTGARGWAYPADVGWGNLGVRHGSASFVVGIESNVFGTTGRSVTLTFGGGPTATVTQPGATCQFAFAPASVDLPAAGGSATVNLTGTGTDCSYTAAVTIGSPWLTVTAGHSGTAPATLTITASPNSTPAARQGQISAMNGILSVAQAGPPIAVDFLNIGFGAFRRPDGSVRVTGPEPIRITNTSQPTATWSATASRPWLVLSPASGTTPATVRVSIDPVALRAETPGFLSGVIDIVSSTAPQTPRRLDVSVSYDNGVPGTQELFVFGAAPFGVMDTPTDGATGLSGAVPITGWAIDRVGITNIRIYRAAVAPEPQGLVYVGDALRVFGARPDLLMFYGFFPESRLAGWGYMLLSNVLPNGGNGTFTFSAYAEDVEGNNTLLGSKTVTFDNARAAKPFGTIDLPAQGQTVSGTIVNRGWVLTPQIPLPKAIPTDGSTIKVYIDGALVSPVTTYHAPRPDVKAFFPGLANSDGPEARLTIDTTLLADGVHTIAWGVIDDAGVPEGIGSRYFTVQNGMSSLVATLGDDGARSAGPVSRLPILKTDVWSREGVDETGWATRVATGADGMRTLRIPRGQRVELFLDPTLRAACGTYDGHLVSGDVAGPLPAGASLDAQRGIFRWQPGAEAAGEFAFVFVQRGCDAVERRIPVTVRIRE